MKKYLPVIFILVCVWTLHLYITAEIARTGYQTSSLKKEAKKIRNENRELAARAAQKESLGKIEAKALGKLHMKYPEKVKYIVVSGEARNSY
ncbi:MAG: hypothetical protein WC527_02140 [Candidatus Margulisiibacteriota bacterium]